MSRILTYQDMLQYDTLEERFQYLKVGARVGEETFGNERYLNQKFYQSKEWRSLRYAVIARDEANDLAVPDLPIHGKIYVHHLNPLTIEEIKHGGQGLMDMNNLVCVSHMTHNAIHYGDKSLLPKPMVERKPGDTLLW